MSSSAEIAERKAALQLAQAGANSASASVNAGSTAITPYQADMQPIVVAFTGVAGALDVLGPAIVAEIATTDAMVPDDTIAPEGFIDSGPAAVTTETSATFTFSGTDDSGGPVTFEGSLDDGPLEPVVSPLVYPGPLSEAPHSFRLRARDEAGNYDETLAVHDWTVVADVPASTELAWFKISGPYIFGDARGGPNLTQGWIKAVGIDNGRILLSEGTYNPGSPPGQIPKIAEVPNFGNFIFTPGTPTGEWQRTNNDTTHFWKSLGKAENYGLAYHDGIVYKGSGSPTGWKAPGGAGENTSPHYGDLECVLALDEWFTRYPAAGVTYRPTTPDEIAHWDIDGLGNCMMGFLSSLSYYNGALYQIGKWAVAGQALKKRDLTTKIITTLNVYPNMPPCKLAGRLPHARSDVTEDGTAWMLADDCELYERNVNAPINTPWTHIPTTGNKPATVAPLDGSTGTDWGIIAKRNEDQNYIVAWCGIAASVNTKGMTTIRKTWILDRASRVWRDGPSAANNDVVPPATLGIRQDLVYDKTNKDIKLVVGVDGISEVWCFRGLL